MAGQNVIEIIIWDDNYIQLNDHYIQKKDDNCIQKITFSKKCNEIYL